MSELPATLRREEMDDGRTYGYVLPRIERMLFSGIFPQPVMGVMRIYARKGGLPFLNEQSEMSDEDLALVDEARAIVVAWMVREVEGEPESLTAKQITDPEQFPEDVAESLWLRALRLVKAPKATPSAA